MPSGFGRIKWEFELQRDDEDNPLGFLKNDVMTVTLSPQGDFSVACETTNPDIDPRIELGPSSVPAPKSLTIEQDFYCTTGVVDCEMEFANADERG